MLATKKLDQRLKPQSKEHPTVQNVKFTREAEFFPGVRYVCYVFIVHHFLHVETLKFNEVSVRKGNSPAFRSQTKLMVHSVPFTYSYIPDSSSC